MNRSELVGFEVFFGCRLNNPKQRSSGIFQGADMNDLAINTDLAQNILTGFIRSEINRVGFARAVVGLSGGVDSSLSCYLAAAALGPQNVLAVRMPYKTSSADSLEHAQTVID
jgi:NAD+ synthase